MKRRSPIFGAYLGIAGGMALIAGVFANAPSLMVAGMALLCAAGLVL